MTNPCCKEMKLFLEDSRDVKYNPIFREYYFCVRDSSSIITMEYCPWCGKKLPRILRDDYFSILEREYDLDIALDEIENNPNLPEEFKSDEWWKKRKL